MLTSEPKRRRRASPATRREARVAYLCLIPAFIGLIFITYLPLAGVFGISFFSWKSISTPSFTGWDNYVRLFAKDPYMMESIKVTLYYALLTVVGGMIYSLLIAIMLNRKIPARGFFRAVYYLPYMLPAVAVYMGWSWLYEANFGLFNYILSRLGFQKVLFLNDSHLAVPSLAVVGIWLSGNLIVIFLAGLQNVHRVYHEAAEIDGANAWQRFINVTLPCMSPIIFYNLLMSLITNMQVVTPALTLTNGGPGKSTTFLTFLMYRYAFQSNQLGYACAVAFIIFILIGIFTAILFKFSGSWIFYEGGDEK